MWTRSELKARGKAAFKANYWRCVLIALLLTICIGGISLSIGTSYTSSSTDIVNTQAVTVAINTVAGIGATLGLIMSLVKILVLNPLEVGSRNFFRKNLYEPASEKEVGTGFHSWARNAGTLLLRDIFLALWSCLFIIPGLIKFYSYRMVPYILADDPDCGAREAIRRSCEMMKGHKWNTFVLDLSFLGWWILTAFTFGILGLFYVAPYQYSTDAALYESIR